MSDSSETKHLKIIDLNLFSGSSDSLRTALGGYFYNYSASAGETVEWLQFSKDDPESPYINSVTRKDTGIEYPSTDGILPVTQFPLRILGAPNKIPDENFWKIYMAGGTFGEESYPALITDKLVYTDFNFDMTLPYSQEEIRVLEGGSAVVNEIEVSYDYNFCLKKYQDYVDTLSSELLIPNMYLITMFSNEETAVVHPEVPEGMLDPEDDDNGRAYDSSIYNFVSLEKTWPSTDPAAANPLSDLVNDISYLTDLIDSDNGQVSGRGTGHIHAIGHPDTDTSDDCTLYDFHLHQYLSGSVTLTPLSSSTTTYVENALQNIIFDEMSLSDSDMGPSSWAAATNTTLKDTWDSANSYYELFPYYVKLSWAPEDDVSVASDVGHVEYYNDDFTTIINVAEYSAKFMKSLKEAFNDEASSVALTTEDYVLAQNYFSSSQNIEYDTDVETTQTTSLRTIDYFDLLSYCYVNPEGQPDNCYILGERILHREAATNTDGTYKYFNSMRALEVIEQSVDLVTTSTGLFDVEMTFASLLNGAPHTSDYDGKYKETIAYRIEKIGGPPTGDSKTQNTLQNFWFYGGAMGSSMVETFPLTYYDTQIKYGQSYTYNIYKYMIVVGVKYQLSNLALTRITNQNDDTIWVEFYDPVTEENIESPYEGSMYEGLGPSESPYKADCMLSFEPSVKIFEVPVFSKTLQVVDHPPNQLNLNPFFLEDSSQTIGYNVNYENFVPEPFPETISSSDLSLKLEYLNANDLLEDDDITLSSRSQQRYLEVYRLNEMPTSYTNFDNHLISTIDLKIKDSIFTLPSAIFYDKISTNQKYYYLFRILNENRVPGQLSEIYEAELINDGGYTYGMFDLLFESDLTTDNFVNPSVAFKKFIQLQPNISQIDFSDADVDYSQTAPSQLSKMSLSTADDPIWDKTFKIRLTSKKTGKKIDLNVTYKYTHDSN